MCYVLGCYDDMIVSAIHKRFGAVGSCGAHNPARHGYAVPFGNARNVPAPLPALPAPPINRGNDDGLKVRRIDAPVPRPSAPALADPF